MGRESAHYWLALPSGAQDDLVRTLERSDAELLRFGVDRFDYCIRVPHRYWIDVRIHCRPGLRLEIRIALTNDTWSIREPLQRVLTPLPADVEGKPLLDENGDTVAIVGEERWWYALEADYGRRRDEFVAVVGDFSAAIPTDHVYTYLHHARKRRDIAEAAQEQRDMEVEFLERLWDVSPPPGEEDQPPR